MDIRAIASIVAILLCVACFFAARARWKRQEAAKARVLETRITKQGVIDY